MDNKTLFTTPIYRTGNTGSSRVLRVDKNPLGNLSNYFYYATLLLEITGGGDPGATKSTILTLKLSKFNDKIYMEGYLQSQLNDASIYLDEDNDYYYLVVSHTIDFAYVVGSLLSGREFFDVITERYIYQLSPIARNILVGNTLTSFRTPSTGNIATNKYCKILTVKFVNNFTLFATKLRILNVQQVDGSRTDLNANIKIRNNTLSTNPSISVKSDEYISNKNISLSALVRIKTVVADPTIVDIYLTINQTNSTASITTISEFIDRTVTLFRAPFLVLEDSLPASAFTVNESSTQYELSSNKTNSLSEWNSSTKFPTNYATSRLNGTMKRVGVADTNYTALSTDHLINFVSLSSPRIVTLPAPSTFQGAEAEKKVFFVTDQAGLSDQFPITIQSSPNSDLSPVTINGRSNYVINTRHGSVGLFTNGTAYYILSTADQYGRTFVNDSDYTLLAFDSLVLIGNITSSRTITLGNQNDYKYIPYKVYKIKDITGNAGSYPIAINAVGATIDGAGSITISSNYGFCDLFTDGGNWFRC